MLGTASYDRISLDIISVIIINVDTLFLGLHDKHMLILRFKMNIMSCNRTETYCFAQTIVGLTKIV